MDASKSSRRWICMGAGFIIQILMGLMYAWSVFVAPLEQEFNWLRSQTSVTFSISLAGFCAGATVCGMLLRKMTARRVVWLSALFVMTGFILTSRISSLPGLYVFYGVLCGVGIGAGYNAVMSTVMPWFPDRQGAVSGILLMGYGLGGTLLGWVAAFITEALGWRSTFALIGVSLGIIVFLLSLLMRPPTELEYAALPKNCPVGEGAARDYPLRDMLKTSSFKFFYIWCVFFSAAGLTIVGHATPISQELLGDDKRAVAVTIAGLVSMMNGVGRLSFGFIIDRIGSKSSIKLMSLLLTAVGLVFLLAQYSGSIVILVIAYVICGWSFGGITPALSTYTSAVFGPRNYPTNVSAMYTVLLISAFIGPSVSGVLQSGSDSYLSTMYMYIVYCVIGLPAAWAIKLHSSPRAKKPKAVPAAAQS